MTVNMSPPVASRPMALYQKISQLAPRDVFLCFSWRGPAERCWNCFQSLQTTWIGFNQNIWCRAAVLMLNFISVLSLHLHFLQRWETLEFFTQNGWKKMLHTSSSSCDISLLWCVDSTLSLYGTPVLSLFRLSKLKKHNWSRWSKYVIKHLLA